MFASSKPSDNVIIKIDPISGYAEFPQPGDARKHLLSILIDLEEDCVAPERVDDLNGRDYNSQAKDFWMPDRLCKLCYGCEDAFTMYRRKHHCRMCGQIFCNQCSSHYIDGVRACRLCFEQLSEQNDRDSKPSRRRSAGAALSDVIPDSVRSSLSGLNTRAPANDQQISKAEADKQLHTTNLQNRASAHFEAIVEQLVQNTACIRKLRDGTGNESQAMKWKNTIVTLVREVVSSVDPNVRKGDSLDIKPYVKLKIIPGGSMSECTYVDGVVFRKTVSHKKMMVVKDSKQESEVAVNNKNPRILLLAGGIDFQRSDARMTSFDTLIEQEDRYLTILVEKIMSLSPTIILVGKAVARRAQELLCEHSVAVMQNIKPHLLERISRMTGATTLPSTDHMIQQYGEGCLGSCALFWLRSVLDDPEKIDVNRAQRVLKSPISRGSTYAYIQGCPPELGCTLVLRGANREILTAVKKTISFCLVLAYHLRLEVAYYNDRCAQLPPCSDADWYSEDSDDDDYTESGDTDSTQVRRHKRCLLSTSLDVDPRLPYRSELKGFPPGLDSHRIGIPKNTTAEDHQTILLTSMVMGMGEGREGKAQKSKAEIMGIRFYSKRDMALGQFLVENCFQLHPGGTNIFSGSEKKDSKDRDVSMLDQTLSYAHRPGRIDITVHRHGDGSAISNSDTLSGQNGGAGSGPLYTPIYMHSYCKECDKIATPEVPMSEETWKMSFGKFLEICFYNKTARGRSNGCNHCIRDCHVLHFSCDGLTARFDFTPIHPYTLHIRSGMTFPTSFHNKHTSKVLSDLPEQFHMLFEQFRKSIALVQLTAEEVLSEALTATGEDLAMVLADLAEIDGEMLTAQYSLQEDVRRGLHFILTEHMAEQKQERESSQELGRYSRSVCAQLGTEVGLGAEEKSNADDGSVKKNQGRNQYQNPNQDPIVSLSRGSGIGQNQERSNEHNSDKEKDRDRDREIVDLLKLLGVSTDNTQPHFRPAQTPRYDTDGEGRGQEERPAELLARYPMFHRRHIFLKAQAWNMRIDTIQRFLEGYRAAANQHTQSMSAIGAVMLPNFSFQSALFSVPEEKEERERDNMNISKMTSPIPGLFGSSTVLAVTPRSNETNTQSYSHTTTRVVDHNAIGEKNSETWKNETPLKISDVRRSAAATTVVEKLEMSLDTPGNSSDYDPSFLSDSFVEGDDALHGELLDRMRMEMGMGMGMNESTSDRGGGGERQQSGGRNRGDTDVLTSADAFSEDDFEEGEKNWVVAASQKEKHINELKDTQNTVFQQHQELYASFTDEGAGGKDSSNRETSSAADNTHITTSTQQSNTHYNTTFLPNTFTESDGSKVPKADTSREEVSNVHTSIVGLSSVKIDAACSTPFTPPHQPVGIASVSTKGPSSGSGSGEVAYFSVGRMVGGNAAGEAVWQPVIPVAGGFPFDSRNPYDAEERNAHTETSNTGMSTSASAPSLTSTSTSFFTSLQSGLVVAVAGSTGSQSSSATCSLSKALIENERKREKERLTKQNRLSKAFARLVLGGGGHPGGTGESKVRVPLGVFGEGRLALQPGRKGEVISVHEEELSTIIAYSLASQEYDDKLQEFLRGEHDSGDFEYSPTHDGSWGAPYGSSSASQAGQTPASRSNLEESADHHRQTTDVNSNPETNRNVFDEPRLPGKEREPLVTSRSHHMRSDSMDLDFEDYAEGEVPVTAAAKICPEDNGSNRTPSPHQPNQSNIDTASAILLPTSVLPSSMQFATPSEDSLTLQPPLSLAVPTAPGPLRYPGAQNTPELDAQSMIMSLAAKSVNEKQLTSQRKSHIRHRFEDLDDKGNTLCKFVINIFWASQFEAVREGFFKDPSGGPCFDHNEGFIRSLSTSSSWMAQGGKSGASFSKSLDDRFIVKVISRVELQMFLEFAPAYFEYMAKAFYNNIPSVLCKILGVYTLGYHNKETGKKTMENVVVMENIFYKRNITHVFDLKGSSRARYVNVEQSNTSTGTGSSSDRDSGRDREREKGRIDGVDEALIKRRKARKLKAAASFSSSSSSSSDPNSKSLENSKELPTQRSDQTLKKDKEREKEKEKQKEESTHTQPQVLLDDNLLELTNGRPFPLKHRAKTYFSKAVSNDTFFLSIISVIDYSILVGFDEDSHEIIVGIIDYMRQYDIVKRVERMGKSVGMLTGQAEPTIIQPSMYRKRFNAAMERYFMTIPDKWVSHDV